jgi:hypothetical protein
MILLLALLLSFADTSAVHVDAGNVIGKIRSFQGVNCGPAPLVAGKLADVTKQYKDLRIDLIRTHDYFGPTDLDAKFPFDESIPKAVGASGEKSIFRDWNKDPEDESSYNFGPSDPVIQAMVGSGAEVYFRLGRSFGADASPPPDFDKFANVSKHIAMHYNDGWAHGYHDKIRYWEVWNEPDISKPNPGFFPGFPDFPGFWGGTPAQYYALYEKTARVMKDYDPNLKVGGPAQAAGQLENAYRTPFVEYCAAHKVPLDFYSWHLYHTPPTNPQEMVTHGKRVRQLLDANGFTSAESHVSEWNLARNNKEREDRNSMENGIFPAAALIYLQDSAVDRALYYRGDSTGRVFGSQGEYLKPAYSLKATAMMLDTPQRLSATADNPGPIVLAGRSANGKKVQVLVCNFKNDRPYALTVSNLPWGKAKFSVKRYRFTATENFTLAGETSGQGGKFELSDPLPSLALELIILEQ